MLRIWLIVKINMAVVLFTFGQSNCSLYYDANWLWAGSDTSTLELANIHVEFDSTGSYKINQKEFRIWIGTQNITMSDLDGELVFYSNGCQINTADDLLMTNGDSLNYGDVYEDLCNRERPFYFSSQDMFSLPAGRFLADDCYLLFHKRHRFLFEPSFHLVTDAILLTRICPDSINGELTVVSKNEPVVLDTNIVSGNFTATRHADGNQWWVVSPDAIGNSFYTILVDSLGVKNVFSQTIGDTTSRSNSGGQAKFSPDGSQLALFHSKSGAFLFDFDRWTGMLSNFQSFGPIDSTSIIGGCEFSPSGRFLYVNTSVRAYQYDLHAPSIPESEVLIGTYDGYVSPFPTRFVHMERTPGNQIFMIAQSQVNVLHVIRYPDRKGQACEFVQHDIILPVYINFSIPHFPNYRLGAIDDEPCDTSVTVKEPDPVSFRVYPNPASGHVFVEIVDNNVHWTWSLFDITGRVVGESALSSKRAELLLGDLQGMYLLRVANEKGEFGIKKLIVH